MLLSWMPLMKVLTVKMIFLLAEWDTDHVHSHDFQTIRPYSAKTQHCVSLRLPARLCYVNVFNLNEACQPIT